MELSLRDSITVAPDIVFRELDGEAVILNLESGIYFGLDQVGTRIAEQLLERFPSRFPDWQRALTYVSDLSQRYSQ